MKPLSDRQKKIRQTRESWGMSQRAFAELIGVSTRTVEDWDRGVNEVPVPVERLVEYIGQDRKTREVIRTMIKAAGGDATVIKQ